MSYLAHTVGELLRAHVIVPILPGHPNTPYQCTSCATISDTEHARANLNAHGHAHDLACKARFVLRELGLRDFLTLDTEGARPS